MAKGFTSAILLAGLGAILFSAKAIVVKLCYAYGADAATVLALRMLFSLPFFWSAVWWVSKTQNLDPVCRKDRFALIVLGFLGYYLSSYLDFLGLETITVGLERIILYLTPAIVLVLSQFLLNKIISKRQWIAMAVAYLGVIVVFAQDVRFDGSEVFDVAIPDQLTPQQDLTLVITRKDGSKQNLSVLCRIDTPIEVDYYRHGGILPYVLRELMAA